MRALLTTIILSSCAATPEPHYDQTILVVIKAAPQSPAAQVMAALKATLPMLSPILP